jgi:NAD(P)-dependent dehydrogenase (short-subunit alcohol dehydrogenase family)
MPHAVVHNPALGQLSFNLVVGRNEQRAKDVVAEIEGSGGSATFRLTTLSDLESAQDLVEWATEAGDGHVDILINNAGVALLGPSNAATEAESTRPSH